MCLIVFSYKLHKIWHFAKIHMTNSMDRANFRALIPKKKQLRRRKQDDRRRRLQQEEQEDRRVERAPRRRSWHCGS